MASEQLPKLQWHAGDAYNKEEGEHLYAIRNSHRYSVLKRTIVPGRMWEWLAVVKPEFGGEIWHGYTDSFLRDAKRRLETEFEDDIDEMREEAGNDQ